MKHSHLRWEDVLDALEPAGAARTGEAAGLDALAGNCQVCVSMVSDARRLLDGLRAARFPQAPAAVIEAALARVLDEARSAAPGRLAGLAGSLERGLRRAGASLREIEAMLLGDSFVPSPALRGGTVASPRMLVYGTDAHVISLSIQPGAGAPGCVALRGQISPQSDAELQPGGQAVLEWDDATMDCPLSPFGEFFFPSVSLRGARLSIVAGETRIRVALAGHDAGPADPGPSGG